MKQVYSQTLQRAIKNKFVYNNRYTTKCECCQKRKEAGQLASVDTKSGVSRLICFDCLKSIRKR